MATQGDEKRNVYLSFHKNFVRENIPYTDRQTGEQKSFNQVRIPSGTVIDGRDLGGYEFSPLFVNESRFKGSDWRDVPLLANKEVWLQKSVLDPEGNPVLDEDGRRQRDTVKVMPQALKDAITESRRSWLEEHGSDSRGLADRGEQARASANAMANGQQGRPFDREQR